MPCFAMATASSSSSSRRAGAWNRPWRWWRRCAGLAAAAHSKIRRSVRWSTRRRRTPPPPSLLQHGWCHHRSFAPVYVDELYSHPPKGLSVVQEEPSSTSGKLAAATSGTTRGVSKARAEAAATKGGVRRSALLSPSRGGGGGAGNMGEVDVRAEIFIRKFREEMRLQSQRSAEELQAMLARGL